MSKIETLVVDLDELLDKWTCEMNEYVRIADLNEDANIRVWKTYTDKITVCGGHINDLKKVLSNE